MMNWEKIAVIAVVAYLAAALPFYLLQNQAMQQCNGACVSQGFDKALASSGFFGEIECQCFEKLTEETKWITIS